MNCKCSICEKEITDKTRIVVSVRHLGRMRVLENVHHKCWNEMAEEIRKIKESLKENPFICPKCGNT
jgi:4-aminobutyrate aminotransferase-like enzyme